MKPVLVQCDWGAARAKGTYYQAQFFRLKARRGPKKAFHVPGHPRLSFWIAVCLRELICHKARRPLRFCIRTVLQRVVGGRLAGAVNL